MLSPEEFREEYSNEELAAELPDSPIGSLRDIQYLYGKLYTLATSGGGEYAPYLTPGEASDLQDTDDSLIVVRVDLSGDEPGLADSQGGPVSITRYTQNLVKEVAHCKYTAAADIDHSVTHQAGQDSSPEKLARYVRQRFTRWATDDVVQEVSESADDGWIIDRMVSLGENQSILDTITEEVEFGLGGESATALVTVRIRTESDGEYQWPGELDVFQEAMRRRKLSKLVTKNKANDSSGIATDLVSGTESRTVGTSEDPLFYYLGKQREKFPGLDIEQAWRSHPIGEDAAVTVMNAKPFVENCAHSTFGARVYYLPYFFGKPDPERAVELYTLLHDAVESDSGENRVERVYHEYQGRDLRDAVRFHITAVNPQQMSRYDVFGESMNGKIHYPSNLATEHERIVAKTAAFVPEDEWTAPIPVNEKWSLISPEAKHFRSISTGWYFQQTFAERDDADPDADDPRIQALVNVLSGDPVSVDVLLEEFAERIISEEGDEEFGFPAFLVASQFAQLCALASHDLNLLSTNDPGKESITNEPQYEKIAMETPEEILADGGSAPAAKLESFIENTPALETSHGQPINRERRGAFLLGALIGDIGSYQEYAEDRSTTLVDQYPVKSITPRRVKKVTQEAIGKTLTYTRKEKKEGRSYAGTKSEHIVDRLRESIIDPDPGEWEIDTDDLRFYYALGVTYGMNDHPDWDSDDANDDTEDA